MQVAIGIATNVTCAVTCFESRPVTIRHKSVSDRMLHPESYLQRTLSLVM